MTAKSSDLGKKPYLAYRKLNQTVSLKPHPTDRLEKNKGKDDPYSSIDESPSSSSCSREDYWKRTKLLLEAVLDLADNLSDYFVMYTMLRVTHPLAHWYFAVYVVIDFLPGVLTVWQFFFNGFGRSSFLLVFHALNVPVLTAMHFHGIKVGNKSSNRCVC